MSKIDRRQWLKSLLLLPLASHTGMLLAADGSDLPVQSTDNTDCQPILNSHWDRR